MRKNTGLDVEVFVPDPLTAFQQGKNRQRGRPKSLTDGELWGMRSSLLDTLDRHWAQIGWELGRAKDVQQLRAALGSIPDSSGRFQFFVRAKVLQATPQSARETAKERGRLVEEIRNSYERQRELQERLDRAKNAVGVSDDSNRAEIEEVCRRRQQDLESFTEKYEKVQQDERELGDRLLDQFAYTAQHELLTFIQSRRYAFNPVNLASAMAGLPNMRWRQSVKRCGKLREKPLLGSSYRSVELLQRVAKKSSKKNFVAVLEAELRKQPKGNFTGQEMRKNWYYLRRCVEAVLKQKTHPGAAPYRIIANYRQRVSAPTQVDLVFQEEEQLV